MKIGVRAVFRRRRSPGDVMGRNTPPIPIFTLAKSRLPLRFAAPLLFVVLLLAGCSSLTRDALVRQTFLLETPMPPVVAHPHPGTLRMGTVNVAAPFRGKTFVHRVSDLRFETDYYVEFLVAPVTMLTEETGRALNHAKPFVRVAGGGSTLDAAWTLDGFASALYADMREPGKPVAELDIAYYLTPTAEYEQTPVWNHQYHQRVPMRDASAAAYAEALNKAFAAIVAELARDLASAQLPKR